MNIEYVMLYTFSCLLIAILGTKLICRTFKNYDLIIVNYNDNYFLQDRLIEAWLITFVIWPISLPVLIIYLFFISKYILKNTNIKEKE